MKDIDMKSNKFNIDIIRSDTKNNYFSNTNLFGSNLILHHKFLILKEIQKGRIINRNDIGIHLIINYKNKEIEI